MDQACLGGKLFLTTPDVCIRLARQGARHGLPCGAVPRAHLPRVGHHRGRPQGQTRASRTAAVCAAISCLLHPALAAEPEVDVDTRCFQFPGQPDKLVQLRLFFADRGANSFAFVRYGGSKKWIPLVLAHRKLVPTGEPDRVEVDTEWLEVVDEQVNGRYLLVSQGAEIGGFDYVNRKTGKKTEFESAMRPGGVDPCASR